MWSMMMATQQQQVVLHRHQSTYLIRQRGQGLAQHNTGADELDHLLLHICQAHILCVCSGWGWCSKHVHTHVHTIATTQHPALFTLSSRSTCASP